MKRLILFLGTISMLMGCKTTEPALSVLGEVSLESYPVKGRQGLLINQKLKFGEYETSRVKRSWTRGGNTRIDLPFGTIADPTYPNLIGMDYTDRDQTYYFQMNDAYGNISDVYGSSNFHSRDLQIGDNPNSIINILEDIFGTTDYAENLFYLQMFMNNQKKPWQLVLDNHSAQVRPKEYLGVFALDEEQFYTLRPITKIRGRKGPQDILAGSIGYEIFNKREEAVAAVSLIDGGIVFFNTTNPEERFLLANLSAALLLQEDVSEE